MLTALARVMAASAIVAVASQAPAQEAAGEDEFIAKVNEFPISADDLNYMNEFLGSRLEQVPAQFRGQVILDVLIDRKLFAEAARAAGVEDNERFKERLAFLAEEALRDIYVEEVMAEAITDEDVKARYEDEVSKLPKTEEMRARHILVETEEAAAEVAEQARGGADFAELAQEKSTGPSGPSGGDLGYFTADRMVPEFSAAAAELEPGEISDPVKSQFGWHVIKLEDRRDKAPPPLEAISEQIRTLVLRDRVKARSEELRKGADIEYAEGVSPPRGDAPAESTGEQPEAAN